MADCSSVERPTGFIFLPPTHEKFEKFVRPGDGLLVRPKPQGGLL